MEECNSQVNNSLVIHLSEDVTVDSILASNHEDFSVNLQEIQFYGSHDYPPKNDKWINLKTIYPQDGDDNHLLELDEHIETQKMIRYIKVIMIGKESNQLYCTLTHVDIYGKSMHVVLKETLKDEPKDKGKPKNISNVSLALNTTGNHSSPNVTANSNKTKSLNSTLRKNVSKVASNKTTKAQVVTSLKNSTGILPVEIALYVLSKKQQCQPDSDPCK
jgi:hypothetical protein